jgi:hypothetical protein
MKTPGYIILIVAITSFISCAPSRFVKPLAKGEKAAGANFGGPLIGFAGTVIPIPLTSMYAGYGLNDRTTLFGSIHTTSIPYGVFQTDIGATFGLWSKDSLRTGLSISPALNIAANRASFKLWPAFDLNYYQSFGKKYSYWYAGVSNWFELSSRKAHNEKHDKHWMLTPQAGVMFSKNNRWSHQVEVKAIGVNRSNENIVVDYKSITGNNGATGIYYSAVRKF